MIVTEIEDCGSGKRKVYLDGQPAFVTARRGVILGDIHVTGREAHAGKAYREGRSAVVELAHQILRLDSFNDFERGIYFNVAPISGGRPTAS